MLNCSESWESRSWQQPIRAKLQSSVSFCLMSEFLKSSSSSHWWWRALWHVWKTWSVQSDACSSWTSHLGLIIPAPEITWWLLDLGRDRTFIKLLCNTGKRIFSFVWILNLFSFSVSYSTAEGLMIRSVELTGAQQVNACLQPWAWPDTQLSFSIFPSLCKLLDLCL